MAVSRMNYEVELVDRSMVYAYKPVVELLLSNVQFSAPMLYTLDDLFVWLRTGTRQLWTFHEDGDVFLFAITNIMDFPQGRMCTIGPIAGRNFRAVLDFMPKFELWAKMQGIVCVKVDVGEKLRRLLERRGYAAVEYAMYKSLVAYN